MIMSDRNLINVESVGHLSARCNEPLGRVLKATRALGIGPALTIDNVDHLAERDAQRVAEYLAEARTRRQG
jgi:hypothetical protein